MAEPDPPDLRAIRYELASARFDLGVQMGHWHLLCHVWPVVIVSIKAKDGSSYAFRCECSGYPSNRPDIGIWDQEKNTFLEPTSRPLMTGRYQLVFRSDWESGQHLYHPMERKAFTTHANWAVDQRYTLWKPDRGLTQLCYELYEILNSSCYNERQPNAA